MDWKPYRSHLLAMASPLHRRRVILWRALSAERDPMLAAEMRGSIKVLDSLLLFADEQEAAMLREEEEAEAQSGRTPEEAGGTANATRQHRSGYRPYNRNSGR